MSYASFFSLSLCFLLLFHSCNAQLDQVTSRRGERERMRQQGNECQIDRLNALEPARRIKSEAGLTEIWDENDEQFQCAGAVAIRHKIRQRGLLLPSYTNGPRLVYVVQGKGIQGAAIPGCPETFQSSSERQRRDQHQKIREIREGDILALPAGVADWVYNNGQSDLVLVLIIDTSNPANQLDNNFRKFFLGGSPQEELVQSRRGQREEGPYQRRESRRGEQETSGNILSGFDERMLAEAFNIDTQLARRLQCERDERGIIVTVKGELEVIRPQHSREEEEEEEYRRGYGGYDNGVEETFCTARLKQNINNPSRADLFNPYIKLHIM